MLYCMRIAFRQPETVSKEIIIYSKFIFGLLPTKYLALLTIH